MADYRKKERRDEPAVEFQWDSLTLASDKTFSTIIRIFISGWWPEGRPKEVAVSYYEKNQKPTDGVEVRIQKGRGVFPLIGLEPGHHYHVVVFIEDRTPVHEMIMVPELPKPKKPEEEELEREQIAFKRAELTHKLEGLKHDQEEQALESDRISLERAKVACQLEKETKEPTEDEKKLVDLKTKMELAKAEKELREVTREKLKDPKHISVAILGERGRQKLLISVSADDDSLISGFTGSVQDGYTLVAYTTGDNGTAVYETNFRDSSRPFEIRAGNHPDLIWRARLLGPKL